MTSKQKQIRAVALAALMVLSVFAGTVAFTGASAAAPDGTAPNYAGGAVHYEDSNGDTVIEVPFDEQINSSSLTQANFTILDDGDNVTADVWNGISQDDDGRVVIETSSAIKSEDIEIDLSGNIQDAENGATLANAGDKSVVFASVTLGQGDTKNAYKGSYVAVEANNLSESIDVEATDDDATYSFSGSTGTNSTVFVFNTENRDLGDYEFVFDNNQSQNATLTVRDLGLNVELDDQNITTDDALEGTASANAGNRDLSIQLLDSDEDEFVNISNPSLDGQGEYDFTFDSSEFSSDDTGEYTVKVTDLDSGVSVESSTVNVDDAQDGDANFGSSVITEARGDVVEIPVTVSNSDYATVNIGSEDVGFLANVTVEDENDDGEVVILFNTWEAINVAGGTSATADVFDVDDSDDSIVKSDIDANNQVSTLLDAGDYDLEVRATQNADDDSQNVATLVLEERNTESVQMWTASDDTDLSDLDEVNEALESGNLTQDSDIAHGDYVITQVTASGLGGIYESREQFFGNEEFNLTFNQTTAPANREAYSLNVSDNAAVVGDSENDTYFIVFDSDDSDLAALRGGNSVDFGADDGITANFTVEEADGNLSDSEESTTTDFDLIEGEHSLDDPYNVSNAAGQIVEGDSNVAPGTELQIRVRSADGTSPSFLKTSTVYVTENNTFSAEFDFSEQNPGDEYNIRVTGSSAAPREEVDGTVAEGSSTTETVTDDGTATVTDEPVTTDAPDTTEAPETTEAPATEEPATEEPTETSTPGFGVVVALTALLAAALLAVRRD
ncbi:PGF-CTERM protein/surface glycoprotein [Halopelagius inordinatus]|uniref:PGF-CTERM protein/surface glycoprotein n=1 Tax=Halopelagius inordinatus TaxID=553467 RepID=A0A1I2RWW0_9EURY|nr:BGTF surface domain-containing protein [Halopelagius inordinatus]SFG45048.1 PGF-CTERM protein/surface glycoprotein [Halopelagius inordinatus]